MPRSDYKTCKGCGKPSSEVGDLSYTRLCAACGHARLEENIVGIATHSGPAFLRYRRAMVAAFGGVLLDDWPDDAQTGGHA